ncbi:hypothetical protein MMA231_00508 [Asticcacaulis sp. MM231]
MSTPADKPENKSSSDGPLLDLTNSAVKKFIKAAKLRGYVTMDELNKVLPSEEFTSEQIEDTLAMLTEMGVNVIEFGRRCAGRRRSRRARRSRRGGRNHQDVQL